MTKEEKKVLRSLMHPATESPGKKSVYIFFRVKGHRKLLCELIRFWHPDVRPAEVVTSFDVCPIDEQIEESTAMGRCVSLVMTCDAIWMDGHWNESKGCRLEHRTAELYGLCIMNHGTLK